MSEQKYDPINDQCNAVHTLNFRTSNKTRVGHLMSLKFVTNGAELKTDMKLHNPLSPDETVDTIGPFDRIAWTQEENSPVKMWFRVTPENRGILRSALLANGGGAEIEVKFDVYEYDYDKKKYFKSFSTDDQMIKGILSEGAKVEIETEPSRDIEQPVNFGVFISLTGQSASEQKLLIATREADKLTPKFGTIVSG